ncbi:MAG TPA: NAD(P)-dependent oxidoreductase [Streptosporangiaceae bacterium]|nr:NAD(P)-dependent oxidoreductase [Streptosporangiaceae bacterium]
MTRVLLTGSSGGVGRATQPALADAGWDVRPFDLVGGQDLRDPQAVLEAMRGCAAVVHAGALAHDTAGSPADIVATNLLGTWHVLTAAEQCGISRVVYFSSAQVFGFAEGEGSPAYLPVDDDHPVTASRPYGMSKRLAEEMCRAWTARTGTPTIVLRPVLILDDHSLAAYSPGTAELGAFVHVEDVAAAVVLAMTAELDGHHRMTLCGPGPFDTTRARTTLGWRATRTWGSAVGSPASGYRSDDYHAS